MRIELSKRVKTLLESGDRPTEDQRTELSKMAEALRADLRLGGYNKKCYEAGDRRELKAIEKILSR